MRLKKKQAQKLLNLSFAPLKKTYWARSLLIIAILALISVLCPITIKPSALLATNKANPLATELAGLQTDFKALSEKLNMLNVAHETLKKNYFTLQDRYDNLTVTNHSLMKANANYISEQKDLSQKLDDLNGMNQYLCERLASQEKKYNDLEFTVGSYLDDYKKYLKEEHDRTLAEYEQQVKTLNKAKTEQTKKPYREYFYSSYDGK
jgi:chromosome segregation ATPase